MRAVVADVAMVGADTFVAGSLSEVHNASRRSADPPGVACARGVACAAGWPRRGAVPSIADCGARRRGRANLYLYFLKYF